MILSHRYRFIFLKNNKCAGSSIEIALSKFCGPDDIVSTLAPNEQELRKSLGYTGQQNYLVPREHYTLGDKLNALLGKPAPRYNSHMRARELVPRIDPEIWNSYFKFCFVRNPWDRVASLHYHRARDGVRTTLDKSKVTTSKVLSRLNGQGWGLYTIKDKVVVDQCCRYENLTDDLEKIRQKLGLPEPIELPNAKAGYRQKKGKQSYREMFNEAEKNLIAKHFRKEIEMFGYQF